jgi:hypothetical protein
MPDIHSTDSWQLLIALLWPYAQEMLKHSSLAIFSWIRKDTPKINMAVSGTVALITTVGIHFSWTKTPDGGNALLMSIPPISALQHVAAQYIGQHMAYRAMISSPAIQAETLKELKTISQILQGGTKA